MVVIYAGLEFDRSRVHGPARADKNEIDSYDCHRGVPESRALKKQVRTQSRQNGHRKGEHG